MVTFRGGFYIDTFKWLFKQFEWILHPYEVFFYNMLTVPNGFYNISTFIIGDNYLKRAFSEIIFHFLLRYIIVLPYLVFILRPYFSFLAGIFFI